MQEPLWHYTDASGDQRGPVPAEAVREAHARGEIPRMARFWREGLADWVGLDSVAAELGIDASPPPPPPPVEGRASFDTGRDPTPRIEPARERAPGPVDPYAAPRGMGATSVVNSGDVVYAGFLRRWAAFFVDEIIIGIPMMVVFVILGVVGAAAGSGGGDGSDAAAGVLVLLAYPIYYAWKAVYYAGQESSVHQATLGKRLLGIKVTDDRGERLSFGHALGRWFGAALSYITIYIGFLMAAFTERKQALHDMVAGTLVVDRWAYTAHPEKQKREVSGCLIVGVIALAIVPILAILAAISISQYQDYVTKSQFSEAPAIVDGLKPQVVEHYARTGECPANGEAGFAAAEEYAGKYVERIELGGTAPACVITARFRGDTVATPLKYQAAKFTSSDAGGTIAWTCEAPTIAAKYLPMSCQ